MARKKDLGSLAALAGLAYMASRDKEGKGPAPSAPSPAASADTGGDFIEAGSGPSGDFMSEKEPGWESGTASTSKPAAAKAKPVAKPRTASNPMDAMTSGDYGGPAEKKKLQYQSLQDRARAYEEERAKSGAGGMYGTKNARREALPTASDMAYKKGGSVKGWGMARGARKAKTY